MDFLSSLIQQWQNGIGEFQFLLAIGLFFIVNFIGSKTYSIGYVPISLLVKEDSKLAFNLALRVTTPVVYLILVSSLFYYLGLDILVKNFYLVSLYYLAFRYIIDAIEGRLELLNWGRQVVYSFAIMLLSYFFYDKFISVKKNMLPDFSNLGNELWIIIILFIYKIVNELEVSAEGAERRKSKYIYEKFIFFKHQYGKIINERIDNDVLKTIVYAVMIYENFNRSKIVRAVENASFYITKKPHTLGLMQITTSEFIDDEQSVILGIRKIKNDYKEVLLGLQLNPGAIYASEEPGYKTSITRREIISKYNTGTVYLAEVDGIAAKLLKKFFPNSKDELGPVQVKDSAATVGSE